MAGNRESVWCRTSTPEPGELGSWWRELGVEVVVGHPTYGNGETIGPLLAKGIAAAAASFGAGTQVCFIVSDGTYDEASRNRATLDAAAAAAREVLQELPQAQRESIHVIVTPYAGYAGDATPGKGSALKLIFDEMAQSDASLLLLLDGDLRNDMAQWHRVFARVRHWHAEQHAGQPMFVTARYARHFVDASLTRFIVGPLTTLMGTYVPGGISGDIALSAEAVAKEHEATWTSARRRYGTDISTTFDNIADPATVVYEVYLGAKLHDITDEAKLSEMPGQVIGAALERLHHWQELDGRVAALLESGAPLGQVVRWGPERTGIGFVDPGTTGVFDVDVKVAGLVDRYDDFAADIEAVVGPELRTLLTRRVEALGGLARAPDEPLQFLSVDQGLWVDILHRAVAFVLARGDVEQPGRALNYLYTAAFLEFVRERLSDLGYRTFGAVRAVQTDLGVAAEAAEEFYASKVDRPAEMLAMRFFEGRARILRHMGELGA